jgi:rod shape-determining protein MreC
MVKGRDDFVIALRSAFFKKKDKQKFSLISLIVLSIFIIVLSNFNFKPIQLVKLGINEVIYRSSYISSIPENKIKELTSKFKLHLELYKNHQSKLIQIENSDEIKVLNNILIAENKRLRELIDESINSEEIFARVIIDRESPYLKSIVLNRGSKDNVKIGMAIMDRNYLVGQIIEVNYSNSRALLLSDLNSKIPVIIQPPFLQAVASGTGKNYGIIEYTKDEYKENQIEKEAVVYTSGLGGIFKPGIPVGKITNKSEQLTFFSDFGQLSFVKIVEFKIGEDQ